MTERVDPVTAHFHGGPLHGKQQRLPTPHATVRCALPPVYRDLWASSLRPDELVFTRHAEYRRGPRWGDNIDYHFEGER